MKEVLHFINGEYTASHSGKTFDKVDPATGQVIARVASGEVGEVNAAYRPTEAQLAWAARVVEQARSGPGAFQLDGEMIDAPVIARAVSLLERAGRAPA